MGEPSLTERVEAREQLYWLAEKLARVRLPLEDEKALQAELARRLEGYGLAFEREVEVFGLAARRYVIGRG